jgi:hypothetical protein
MTEQEMKQWIDNASYHDLFYKWRFEPAGSPWFQPPIGDYFAEVFTQRKKEISPEEHTATSKAIGW